MVKANAKLASVLLFRLAGGLLVLVHLALLSTALDKLISDSLVDVLEVFEVDASRQRKKACRSEESFDHPGRYFYELG